MSRAVISTLYERGVDHRVGNFPDLRHAITQLQFGCIYEERPVKDPAVTHVEGAEVAGSQHGRDSNDGSHEWRLLDTVANILCSVDSYMHRGSTTVATQVSDIS